MDEILFQDPRKQQFIEKLESCYGLQYIALRECNISRNLLNDWMHEDCYFRDCCEEIRERLKDSVEMKLIQNIMENDQRAIEYWLNAKAKDRGFAKDPSNLQQVSKIEEIPEWMKNLALLPVKDNSEGNSNEL